MKSFLALFYPIIELAGFRQVYETIRFVWKAKLLEGAILEAEFELFLRKTWNKRWTILSVSAFWLIFSAMFFATGVFFENPVFVFIGGSLITLYVWLSGMTVQTLVSIYYRILKHNCDGLALVPSEFLKWLELMGVHERPFRKLPTDDNAAARLDTQIHNTYIYLMIVSLSYTFWLGMFPDVKVWVMTLVIFSGVLLLVLLSHLLGGDGKKPLRALRLLTLCYIILAIKIALGVGLFPNFAEFMRTKFIPKLGENINSIMMGWVTPSEAAPAPPCNFLKDSPLDDTLTPDLIKVPTSPAVLVSNNHHSESAGNTNHTSGESPKKRRNLKVYLDERRAKLRVDFPDLFPNQIETPASLPAEQTVPTTGETITPFGLPPIKQLP